MCLFPTLIKNPKYKANKKNGGQAPPIFDDRVAMVPIGCGKCMECCKQKANNWRVRLHEEIRKDNTGTFVTLTFNTEQLRKLYETIRIKHKLKDYELDNAVARLAVRRFLERWRKENKRSVKHWLVTELGGKHYEHLHIHGIIWTKDKDKIEKHWQYGYVYGSKEKTYVNEKTINYIVKYIFKIDEKHKAYKAIILTSSGIGSNYINRSDVNNNIYKGEETNERYKTRQGYEVALPIYYRNKIYSEEEREKLWIDKLNKQKRYVLGSEIDISNGEDEYWMALKYAQRLNKELGYGGDANTWEQENYERELRRLKQMERLYEKKKKK